MRVSIAGASGYVGGELMRLLENHPRGLGSSGSGPNLGGLGENVPRNSAAT